MKMKGKEGTPMLWPMLTVVPEPPPPGPVPPEPKPEPPMPEPPPGQPEPW